MKLEIMFSDHFMSEEMATSFLKEKNIFLLNDKTINSVTMQVHHNKENSPLYLSFMITWENEKSGGGEFHEFPFIDYYNWFEKNKKRFFSENFFNEHLKNIFHPYELSVENILKSKNPPTFFENSKKNEKRNKR